MFDLLNRDLAYFQKKKIQKEKEKKECVFFFEESVSVSRLVV